MGGGDIRVCLLLLCLLLASATLSGAVLTGSFAATGIRNISVASNPFTAFAAELTDFSLSFLSDHLIQIDASLDFYKAMNPVPVTEPVHCYFNYAFQLPAILLLTAVDTDPAVYCEQAVSPTVPPCPWFCDGLLGQFIPFFSPPVQAERMIVGTGVETSIYQYNWGSFSDPLQLSCNTTSCGDTVGIFPPTPLPANVSFEVRRSLLCWLMLINAERQCDQFVECVWQWNL